MMRKKDKNKTSFLTILGVYDYRLIPFVLNNAGATFQGLMDGALIE